MKNLIVLVLAVLLAAASPANARDWKPGTIDLTSETRVSSKLGGEKSTLHYTIQTADRVYFAEYSYKPGHDGEPPKILLSAPTNIAIEGNHAYVLDVTGKEVKLHLVKKPPN